MLGKDAPRRRTQGKAEKQSSTPRGRRAKIERERGRSTGPVNALEDRDAKGYSCSRNSVIVIQHLSGLDIVSSVRV